MKRISAVVAICLGVSAHADAQIFDQDVSTGFEAVQQSLAVRGWAPVIVKLEVADYRPEGTILSTSDRALQRSRIAARQSALIGGLNSDHVRIKRRFKLIPYVSMEVSPDGLEAIRNNPMVSLITADLVGEASGASTLEATGLGVPTPTKQPTELVDSPESSSPPPTAEARLVVGADVANANGCDGDGWAIAILDSGIQNDHATLVGRVSHEACFSTHSPGLDQFSMCPGNATEATGAGVGDDCTPCRNRTPFNGPGPFTYDPPDCDFWPPVQVACPHGTLITGPAAGDGLGVVGIAPEADVISIKVMTRYENTCLQTEGDGDLVWERGCPLVNASDLMAGIEHVAELAETVNIAALNISIDMTDAPGAPDHQSTVCDGLAALSGIKDAVDVTNSYGIPTAAATGNNNRGNRINPPACLSNVISVAYTQDGSMGTQVDSIGHEPNRASFLDFWAPGEWVEGGWPHDAMETTRTTRGTSLASPQVAAAFAALRSKGGTRGIDYYKTLLESTGEMVTDNKASATGPATFITKPRIDVGAACLGMSAVTVDLTVLLEGPYVGGGMMAPGAILLDSLPTTQPFGNPEFAGTVLEYTSPDAVPGFPGDVVDWIELELRSGLGPETIVAKRPALLLTDGSVVDFDGVSAVSFLGVDSLSYRVVVRHRNHGDIMTPGKIGTGDGLQSYNFTTAMNKAYGTNPMKQIGSDFVMWGGDINIDAQVTASDFNTWLVQTKSAAEGYKAGDITLDGQVTAADFNIWLANTKAARLSQVVD